MLDDIGNRIRGEVRLQGLTEATALNAGSSPFGLTFTFKSLWFPRLELKADFLPVKLQVSSKLAALLGDKSGDEAGSTILGELDDLLARDGALEDGLARAEFADFSAPIDWSQT